MKIKFIALLAMIAIAFNSCDISDDGDQRNYVIQAVAVTAVEIPDPFVFGEINDIVVRYDNPTNCHNFLSFNVVPDLNRREVTVVTEAFLDASCEDTNVPVEQVLQFRPTSNGTIVFRFFSGFSADGEREYLEYTVDVQE